MAARVAPATDVSRDMSYNQHPNRVLLWATPRSMSTSFLTAMSQLDGIEAWYEPYFTARKLGPEKTAQTLASQHFAQKYTALKQSGYTFTIDMEGGYDTSLCTYDWVKDQLERNDLQGKQAIFVKEMIEGIIERYDTIANGFTHSFLIRHPLKVFASLRKMINTTPNKDKKMTDFPSTMIPSGGFYKDMWELLQYLRQKGDITGIPVIIDADDLLRDPEGIMKAYCESMNIPFSESLLQWNPGEDRMTEWMISDTLFQAFRVADLHKNTFTQSGFGKPSAIPDRSGLPDDVLCLADASMPYYDMLFRERLTVN